MNANLRFAVRATVLLAVAALVGVSIVLLEGDDDAMIDESGSGEVRGALANQQQRRLRFCVQAVDFDHPPFHRAMPGDPAVEKRAKERIEDALKEVAKHPYWEAFGHAALGPPVVDIGCPSPPIMFVGGGDVKILGRRVWEPSYYGVSVFILPDDKLAELAEWGSPASSEEFMAGGDQAWGVTIGLYLTESQLEEEEYMTDMMTRAVGIEAFEKALPR